MSVKLRNSIVFKRLNGLKVKDWKDKTERKHFDNAYIVWNTKRKENDPAHCKGQCNKNDNRM